MSKPIPAKEPAYVCACPSRKQGKHEIKCPRNMENELHVILQAMELLYEKPLGPHSCEISAKNVLSSKRVKKPTNKFSPKKSAKKSPKKSAKKSLKKSVKKSKAKRS